MSTTPHPGTMKLRRLALGELSPDEAATAQAHTTACQECQGHLATFSAEQRDFEASVPFERFAAGVERARRQPRAARPGPPAWRVALVALAAGCVLTVGARVVLDGSLGRREPSNRIKGGGIEVVVAGAGNGPQRLASSDPAVPEPLSPGEHVRLGYSSDGAAYVLALSIDEQGTVTPIYPEEGSSLAVEPGTGRHFLPGSIEFTGSGLERVVLVLSVQPLSVELVAQRLREAYARSGGRLLQLASLEVSGTQFHRTFLKP